ncbi:MAG: hypothetical protein JWR16_1701, partial [Nevskia sp.]|nr:hypothetical protein [Nevskia sp.]
MFASNAPVSLTRSTTASASRPLQNWILDPTQDAVFIIAAPLLVLALALLTFHFVSPADAAALIILVHMVMTVAHHL